MTHKVGGPKIHFSTLIQECIMIQTSSLSPFKSCSHFLFPCLTFLLFPCYNFLRLYNQLIDWLSFFLFLSFLLWISGLRNQDAVQCRLQTLCKHHIWFSCLDSHRNIAVTAHKAGLMPAKYSFNGIAFPGDWEGLAAIWPLWAPFPVAPQKWIALPQAVKGEIKK